MTYAILKGVKITIEQLTTCMCLRGVSKGDTSGFRSFICGVDILERKNGEHIMIDNCNHYGFNALELIAAYFCENENSKDVFANKISNYKEIILCDDPIRDEPNAYVRDVDLLPEKHIMENFGLDVTMYDEYMEEIKPLSEWDKILRKED